MPAISKFDRATIRATDLPAKVVAALAALAAEHGLTIDYAGGSFEELSFTMKVKLTVADPATTKAKAASDFAAYCGLYDLRPEHLGGLFVSRGTAYRLTGINPGRDRYPLTGERVADGKRFKFGAELAPTIRPASPATA